MATFGDFWTLYPRKVARINAEKAWKKAKGDEIGDDIVAGLKKQLPHWTDPKFIPHAASWLNAGRWMDQLHVDVRPAPAPTPARSAAPWVQQCAWRALMNTWLIAIVRSRQGVELDVLRKLVAERNRLADQCKSMWGDEIGPNRDLDVLKGMLNHLRAVA